MKGGWKTTLRNYRGFVAARLSRPRCFVAHMARRFHEENFDQISGSLAFTTLLSLVPLIALIVSLVDVLPVLSGLIDQLDRYLARNLLPERSAGTIARHIRTFSHKAADVTVPGLLLLAGTAFLLLNTIEGAFNHVWKVAQPRPLWRRLRLYAVAVALWPLALGLVAGAVSYAVTASFGLVDEAPWLRRLTYKLVGALIIALFLGGLYYSVPHAPVRLRDAAWGGLFTAAVFSMMQRAFELYLSNFPSYKVVYGAFATAPIFLLWLYLSWAAVLIGALFTATLSGVGRSPAVQASPGESMA